MGTINGLIDGLRIIASKLEPKKQYLSAEHDIIYACHVEDIVLSEDEKAALKAAGWHINSEFNHWAFFT